MTLFLHKLLPILLLPLGFSICLLLIALLFKKRWIGLLAVAILTITGMPIVGDSLLRILENRYPKIEVENCPQADAVVVLGGILRKTRRKTGGLEWGEPVDRFEQGVLLMLAAKAPRLVFPGGVIPWSNRKVPEGDDLKKAAVARGIPEASILVTEQVGDTAGEAQAVSKMGFHKVILVTTAWHMPRALYLFRKRGIEAIPFPVDYQTAEGEPITLLDLLPQAHGLENTEITLRETYGLLYYHFAQ